MKIRVFCMFIVPLSLFALIWGCNKGSTEPTPTQGVKWRTFTHANTAALRSDKVNTMLVDAGGRVWFGTDSGAVSVSGNAWTLIRDSLSYPTYSNTGEVQLGAVVTAIAEGMDLSLWFGTAGGGVRRFKQNSQRKVWQTYSVPDISSEYVNSIAAVKAQTGDVYVTSLFGVSRFVPGITDPEVGVWSTVGANHFPSSSLIEVAAVNPVDNSVFFGTDKGAVSYDNDVQWKQYPISSPYSPAVISFAFDLSRTVWMGKWDGVTRWNYLNGDKTHYTTSNTGGKLPSGYVNAVATDYHSTRWFGTMAGLVQLKDTTWTTFTQNTTPELPSDIITALAVDSHGNLWIGTDHGVAEYNEQGIK